MKVLVTGASGLLGAHIASGFAASHQVTGADRNAWWGDRPLPFLKCDLNEPAEVRHAMAATRPGAVIHCAGLADVDACERDPDRASIANVVLTRNLVSETPLSCLFVYISTDSVFSGDSRFWPEDHKPAPRNVYARSKLQGEEEVRKLRDHLIIRTNFYGWSSGRKKTSAEWLYRALAAGEAITLFEDFYFTPIYAPDLVRILRTVIDRGARGVLHLAGRDRVSKYSFGETMARLMGVSMKNVRRGSILESNLSATRSTDISLNTQRARDLSGGDMPGCEEGLKRFLADKDRPLSRRWDAQI